LENGEIMSEPLNIFGKDDPVTCAVYACKHWLLEEEGWKRFKGIAKCEKKMLCMVNQSRIKATCNAPRYKFGYCIPRNYNEAMQFDLRNGNTWQFWNGYWYGRYGAAYNMVGLICFNDKLPCVWVELLLLPKNPTEANLQATSTWGESTEPTKGVMKHTYKVVLYNYCLMQ
jgi:hypothetical protein